MDDKGKLPLFGLGGLFDSSRAQGQIESWRNREREMLAQALLAKGKARAAKSPMATQPLPRDFAHDGFSP